jgi:type I restriction enzyme, S subunit
MELKQGYKQTEAGVIPKEWDCVKLGNFISLQRGHDLTWRDRRQGDVPVMGSAGQNGFHDTAIAKGPGVVLGRSGASFGQAHYCEQDFWPHNTALYVTDFRGNLPLFVFYFLKATDFSRHNSGGAQQSLNRNFISPIVVGVPRPHEQRGIAEALSDVDALLGGLDRLIAKKHDLKQAAMQQLLTGQTRLPGFLGEWETKRLGDVVDTDSENLSSETRPDFTFNYIALEDVDRGFLRSYSEQRFVTAPSRARRKLRMDDVLVSTVRPNLQSHLLFHTEGSNWVCSTGFCVVRCRKGVTHPGYVFFQLFMTRVTRQIEALLTGSNYPAINSGDVRALEIPLPDFAEQTAIADILSDMEAELAALEARRAKTRALKQAMMQELLTGKTRLVTLEAIHD